MRLSWLKIYRLLLCLFSRHPTRLDIYKILYWVGHTLDYQPCISGVAFQSILHILQLDEGEEWKPKKWCCFCLEFWSESPDWVGQVDVMFSVMCICQSVCPQRAEVPMWSLPMTHLTSLYRVPVPLRHQTWDRPVPAVALPRNQSWNPKLPFLVLCGFKSLQTCPNLFTWGPQLVLTSGGH